jgi:hypothetical protein
MDTDQFGFDFGGPEQLELELHDVGYERWLEELDPMCDYDEWMYATPRKQPIDHRI